MRTLLYLLFLTCLVPLLFFASLVQWTPISRAWARLRGASAQCRQSMGGSIFEKERFVVIGDGKL